MVWKTTWDCRLIQYFQNFDVYDLGFKYICVRRIHISIKSVLSIVDSTWTGPKLECPNPSPD